MKVIPGKSEKNIDQLPPVLTVEEVARYLRIGRNQAYEQIRAGEIPSIRFGKSYRIPREGLRKLLDIAGNSEA